MCIPASTAYTFCFCVLVWLRGLDLAKLVFCLPCSTSCTSGLRALGVITAAQFTSSLDFSDKFFCISSPSPGLESCPQCTPVVPGLLAVHCAAFPADVRVVEVPYEDQGLLSCPLSPDLRNPFLSYLSGKAREFKWEIALKIFKLSVSGRQLEAVQGSGRRKQIESIKAISLEWTAIIVTSCGFVRAPEKQGGAARGVRSPAGVLLCSTAATGYVCIKSIQRSRFMSDFSSCPTKGVQSKKEGKKPQAPKGRHHTTSIYMCEEQDHTPTVNVLTLYAAVKNKPPSHPRRLECSKSHHTMWDPSQRDTSNQRVVIKASTARRPQTNPKALLDRATELGPKGPCSSCCEQRNTLWHSPAGHRELWQRAGPPLGKAGLLEKQLQLVQRVRNKVQLISILLTFPGQCIDFSPKAKPLSKGQLGVSRSHLAPPPGKAAHAAPGSVDTLLYTLMSLVLEMEGCLLQYDKAANVKYNKVKVFSDPHPIPPVSRLGDTAGTADPNWPKGYSIPYDAMLSI
ncbi:hypothetical protein QYF61_009329 [Mycteria americana]|uniref:Uncharacterized protein n=1 Tax=Mycteria americana TaxID=33587 RepID=A0AAN7P7M5_MYCAM|nr:hypothetical protein QYF61_009329 [Mycteria americana]